MKDSKELYQLLNQGFSFEDLGDAAQRRRHSTIARRSCHAPIRDSIICLLTLSNLAFVFLYLQTGEVGHVPSEYGTVLPDSVVKTY